MNNNNIFELFAPTIYILIIFLIISLIVAIIYTVILLRRLTKSLKKVDTELPEILFNVRNITKSTYKTLKKIEPVSHEIGKTVNMVQDINNKINYNIKPFMDKVLKKKK